MEAAELAARIAAAHEQAVAARRNTKLLDLESMALDRKSGPHWPTPNSADRSHSPLLAGDLTRGFMDNALVQQQRAEEHLGVGTFGYHGYI